MRHALLSLVLLVVSFGLGACRSASNGHLYLQAGADDDRISTGDTVSVVDKARPDVVMASARIGSDGQMEFPGLGKLDVSGQSELELHEMLRERYNEVYGSSQLEVSVVRPGMRFYVYGEVARPGRYVLEKGLTALEGTMLAGPDDSYADLTQVRLIRGPKGEERTTELNIRSIARGKTNFNVALEDGDILYVPPTAVGHVLSPMLPSSRRTE
ncbi:MAG: polysaccharide biosynthesis/export family protein [Planctomycetes bacterium]|nr:polysaccharide biosynthesis/export family protein [Planctomycetota bacterium]HPF15698.1 polysaccharide biosynthesis/export family protein [Planctomycetota bacterium]HRV83019.1 polysaccharide biosynthesis/export family protein [Planctomycetota bacterium]